MKLNNIYTSVSCNRTPQSADWGNNGLILFAASNSVSILDPNFNGSSKITHTFVQHNKHVNTVKWVRKTLTENENQFISGADDCKAIIWNLNNIEKPSISICLGHTNGINAVETIYINNILEIATSSSDTTIRLWQQQPTNPNHCECLQTIDLNGGYCFTLKMTKLPTTEQILLAFGLDDYSISLWTETENKPLTEHTIFAPIHKFVGHEDWIRCLDFIEINPNELLLASSSQDQFIRLWRISLRTQEQVAANKLDLLNLNNSSTTPDDIHVEEKIINIEMIGSMATGREYQKISFAVSLESVLQGHDSWVYSVQWHQDNSNNELKLLSSSIDKTLVIWKLTEDGVWMEDVRVGEVGGNSLGFYGGKFSPSGRSIMGHGFVGSFHIWNQSLDDESIWKPHIIVGGHFRSVRDICWEPNGEFLYSVSADQTARIHGPWQRLSNNSNEKNSITTWHEIARPQIHGYDMQAIAVLSRYKYASGAEEKIIRTFQASGNFIENFRNICKITDDYEGDKLLKILPKGASVPSLGLSNKAVYNVEEDNQQKHIKDQYPENYFIPHNSSQPPEEETLMQNTLWPEIQKLYGHGFEIFALTASADGKLLASSCRATAKEDAKIILWNTNTWKYIQKLESHQLTVTQMKFSPNLKYLLSVSRDRKWTLFAKNENNGGGDNINFERIANSDKLNGIHSRIIWSCDWSHDSKIFATSSRDGKAVIWGFKDDAEQYSDPSKSSLGNCYSLGTLELENSSITAIAFAPIYYNSQNGAYLIALGLENGDIYLYTFEKIWKQLYHIGNSYAHHMTVTKLQFRPHPSSGGAGMLLASCGDDNFIRINEILL